MRLFGLNAAARGGNWPEMDDQRLSSEAFDGGDRVCGSKNACGELNVPCCDLFDSCLTALICPRILFEQFNFLR